MRTRFWRISYSCRSVYYLIGIYWLLIFRIFHPTHHANRVKYKCVNLGKQDAVSQIAKFKTEWYKRILSILFCYSEVTQSEYKSSVVRWHAELLILAFLAPIEENKFLFAIEKNFIFIFEKKIKNLFREIRKKIVNFSKKIKSWQNPQHLREVKEGTVQKIRFRRLSRDDAHWNNGINFRQQLYEFSKHFSIHPYEYVN